MSDEGRLSLRNFIAASTGLAVSTVVGQTAADSLLCPHARTACRSEAPPAYGQTERIAGGTSLQTGTVCVPSRLIGVHWQCCCIEPCVACTTDATDSLDSRG